MQNKLLNEMDTNDLNRRYSSTFVRYNGKMIYAGSIEDDRGRYINYIDAYGKQYERFDGDLIDISRPTPKWIMVDGFPYYLNYMYERQWHRGFCRANTNIRKQGTGINMLPKMVCLTLLEEFYTVKPFKRQVTKDEIVEEMAKNVYMLLSPNVLIVNNYAEKDYQVFYKERYIGKYGYIESIFEQELKELVRDYSNENIAQPIRNQKQAERKRPAPKVFRLEGDFFDLPRAEAAEAALRNAELWGGRYPARNVDPERF